jgi:hypothetical protein
MDEDLRIEHKRKLLAKGKWGRFTARLLELRDEGFTEEGAWIKAYEEMRVDGEGEDVGADRAGGVPARKKRVKKDEEVKPEVKNVIQMPARPQAVSAETIIEWIAEHLNDDANTVYDSVPTRAALNMLVTLRTDDRAKSKFYLDTYMRQLLSSSEREHEERRRMGDDGRVLRLLDDFERMSEQAAE